MFLNMVNIIENMYRVTQRFHYSQARSWDFVSLGIHLLGFDLSRTTESTDLRNLFRLQLQAQGAFCPYRQQKRPTPSHHPTTMRHAKLRSNALTFCCHLGCVYTYIMSVFEPRVSCTGASRRRTSLILAIISLPDSMLKSTALIWSTWISICVRRTPY